VGIGSTRDRAGRVDDSTLLIRDSSERSAVGASRSFPPMIADTESWVKMGPMPLRAPRRRKRLTARAPAAGRQFGRGRNSGFHPAARSTLPPNLQLGAQRHRSLHHRKTRRRKCAVGNRDKRTLIRRATRPGQVSRPAPMKSLQRYHVRPMRLRRWLIVCRPRHCSGGGSGWTWHHADTKRYLFEEERRYARLVSRLNRA
jgi:hypothetical protein